MVYYGLLLFFVLEYARPGSYIPGINALRLNSLVPIGVVLGTLVTRGPVSGGEVIAESNSKIVGGLMFMIIASFAVASVTMMAFELFTTVLGYVLVYWVIAMRVTTVPEIKGLFVTLIGVHLLLAALTPAMFTDPDTRHYIAAGTFLGDGNDYALSVNLVIPFCLFLLSDAKNMLRKIVCACALLMLVICVVATQSRGGTIALAFVAFYYWLSSKKKVMTGSVAVAGLIAVMIYAPPAYFTRMNTISNYEQDGSAQGRITAWKAGTAMMLSNPLLGVGAGNFPANYTRFAPVGPTGPETRWKTAHSIYFLILGELGLPGLGLLLAFIIVNLRQNRRLMRQIRERTTAETPESALLACLSASVFAYAIAGAFLSATYYPHMFVLAGLLVSARRLARVSLEAQEAPPAPAVVERVRPRVMRPLRGGRRAS